MQISISFEQVFILLSLGFLETLFLLTKNCIKKYKKNLLIDLRKFILD